MTFTAVPVFTVVHSNPQLTVFHTTSKSSVKLLKICNKSMDKMDTNPIKKVRLMNSPTPESLKNVDGSNSGNLKINKLIYNCLVKVLMHLPILDRLEMEKVCQKWKKATEVSLYNVKKINFNDLMIPLDKKEETCKEILTKCRQYLTHLTVNAKYTWICDVLTINCQNIIHFEVDMDLGDNKIVPEKDLLQIVSTIPELKYFKIKMNKLYSQNVCTQLMKKLPDNIEEIHLISLNFVGHYNKLKTISATPDKFKRLRCLTLQGLNVYETTMELIALSGNTLVYLDLSRSILPFIVTIFSTLNNLEYLDLRKIRNFDGNGFRIISRNCPKLKHLGYVSASAQSQTQLRFIRELTHLENLEYLDFMGVQLPVDVRDNKSLLPNDCEKFKHLNLDQGLKFSASDIEKITKLKNLESLNLESAQAGPESLIQIANNCLELKDLKMNSRNVTEAVLEKLTNLKKLEQLHLCGYNILTGNLLINIISSCKNLISIDISSCNNLTEDSLIQVAKVQLLKKLVINGIDNIPISMFDYLHKLEFLSCSNCPSVTDEYIMKVMDNCENLSELYVCKTGITSNTIVHASNRKFLFKILRITIDKLLKDAMAHSEDDSQMNALTSPYLAIRVYF